jgi:hypothetical protein
MLVLILLLVFVPEHVHLPVFSMMPSFVCVADDAVFRPDKRDKTVFCVRWGSPVRFGLAVYRFVVLVVGIRRDTCVRNGTRQIGPSSSCNPLRLTAYSDNHPDLVEPSQLVAKDPRREGDGRDLLEDAGDR